MRRLNRLEAGAQRRDLTSKTSSGPTRAGFRQKSVLTNYQYENTVYYHCEVFTLCCVYISKCNKIHSFWESCDLNNSDQRHECFSFDRWLKKTANNLAPRFGQKNYQQSDRWSMTDFSSIFNSAQGVPEKFSIKITFLEEPPFIKSTSPGFTITSWIMKQIGSGWTFYRRICNVFSMIFFISEKWLISWNENFLFPIVVVNSQSNIVRGVPIGIPHSHISFTNSSSSLGL